MNKATVIEMVLFRTKEGIKTEDAKKELIKLNDFVASQAGFISRKTAFSDDGQYLDIVYWADMNAAKTAVNNSMHDSDAMKSFSVIEQKTVLFSHFEIFNDSE